MQKICLAQTTGGQLLHVVQGSYGQEKSGKKPCFSGQSGKVMRSQEVLMKLEESQEKVRNFYQLGEFCGAQL